MIVFPRGEVKAWSDLTPGAPFLSIAGLSKLRPIGNVTRPSASGLAARADRGLRIWLDEGKAGSAEGHFADIAYPDMSRSGTKCAQQS